MQAKLRSKTHRCLVGFVIVMLSTPLLFIVNRPCYTLWYYGYIITLVKEEVDKSLINKYRLYGNINKNGELSIIQKIDIHLFKFVSHFEYNWTYFATLLTKFIWSVCKILENQTTFLVASYEMKYCTST